MNAPRVQRTWTVTIVHEGVNPNTGRTEEMHTRQQIRGVETDTEAVVCMLARTMLDREARATRITRIDVG